MIELDVERLRSVGLTPAQAQALLSLDAGDAGVEPLRAMRVIEVHRETLRVHDGDADRVARLHPSLARALDDAGTAIAVGDWVAVLADRHRDAWVRALAPRLNHLARRDADGRSHPVVSNVDTALITMGLDDDFNPRRLERFLSLVQGCGVWPVIVLTKADCVSAATLALRLDELEARLPRGVDVHAVDGRDRTAADALAPYLGVGQTLVAIGSSGAGKSTLTNTLLGQAVQDTGAVREHDSRGKHTTTSRSLHRLPGGACVIDTPGLRTLRPDVGEDALAATFGDIASLAGTCRFRNCTHHDEPGCAVREGVDRDRLANYHKLIREARRDTLTPLDRRRQLSQWKTLSKAVRARMRGKREAA
jgi:ribosome biogenesis GTPase